jgi:uncharacterized membrane protein YbhN (UPF0104 family)
MLKIKKIIRNKKTQVFIQIFFSALFIYLILSKLDLTRIWGSFKTANNYYLFTCIVFFFLNILGGVERWRALMKKYSNPSFKNVVLWVLCSSFFNFFVPGGVAGDFYRIYGNKNDGLQNTVISVFLDRIVGMISFVILGAIIVSISRFFKDLILPKIILLFYFYFILIILITLGYLLIVKPETNNIKIDRYLLIFNQYLTSKNEVSFSLLFGIGTAFLNILVYHFAAKSLNININLLYHLIFIPPIIIISTLPISFRGLGIREVLIIKYYGSIGISPESCISFSFIYFSIMIIGSLLSGIIYLLIKNKKLFLKAIITIC